MCVYACWDWYISCNGVEIIPRLVKVAAENSVCRSPYQHCQSRYLRGESPRTGNFAVHLQYPFTVQSTIFLFQMKPQLPHCWFSTPLWCSLSLFFFFPSVASLGCGFLTTHSAQEACWGKNRSLSLFPLLTEDHRAKFKPNNKITGAQNTHFPIHRGLI